MKKFNFAGHPHRRLNPLTNEWVLVSPNRTERPWQGRQENIQIVERPTYDENCYLCPGNKRAGEKVNPQYENTFVFTNDFASLLPDTPEGLIENDTLFKMEGVKGTSRVICFSPRHDLTLPEMEIEDIRKVVDVWCGQVTELGARYKWVQIFENKGELMGCSNPHPHGQIWAGSFLPNEPFKELHTQKKYFEERKSLLLIDYLNSELEKNERIVLQNEHWVVLVPFWATWPFECLLLPKRKVKRLNDLTNDEKNSLSEILKKHLIKYDNLFNISFPYSMGWHGAPTDVEEYDYWQLHAHFYPPLLRSATVKKFLVGYEMLAEVQRDITPEQAAEQLQNLPEIHFRTVKK